MTYKTPDIYIEEIPVFPPSVAEVETAIPVFIGHTRFAEYRGESLTDKPIKITSTLEYHQRFGKHPPACIDEVLIGKEGRVESVHRRLHYNLYDAVHLFFLNGGGACYILSVGDFSYCKKGSGKPGDIDKAKHLKGLDIASKVDEVTLLIMPDAVNLGDPGLYTVQQQALMQCNTLQDRFCILDLAEGGGTKEDWEKSVKEFRDKVGISNLKYGAAYTPFIVADIDRPIQFSHIRTQLYKGSVKPDNKIQLKDLTDDPAIVAIIGEVERAVDALHAVSSVSYGNLPQTSPLVNTMPNLYYAGPTDIEIFLEKDAAAIGDGTTDKAKTLLENYNRLATLSQPRKKKNDEGEMIEIVPNDKEKTAAYDMMLNLLKDVICKVVLKKWYQPNSRLPDDLVQFVGDTMTGFLEALADNASTTYPALIKPLATWKDDFEGAINTACTDAKKLQDSVASLFDVKAVAGVKTTLSDRRKQTDILFRSFLQHLRTIQDAALHHFDNVESTLDSEMPIYSNIIDRAERAVKTLPPSGAMAGIYSAVDHDRGVWKAPANVSLSATAGLTRNIDSFAQESLNIDVNAGKSINAIRPFPGKGLLVWGARTLMGNDNEWKYVSVRRFFIMVEESLKKSTYWAVFEPNDATLWMKIKSSTEHYLHEKRMQGALAGATDADAFQVNVGLGATMTAQDILEGRLIIEIKMAVVRPAEFIIMRFMHKMQES